MSKTIKVLGVELRPYENKEIEGYTYRDYKIINREQIRDNKIKICQTCFEDSNLKKEQVEIITESECIELERLNKEIKKDD